MMPTRKSSKFSFFPTLLLLHPPH